MKKKDGAIKNYHLARLTTVSKMEKSRLDRCFTSNSTLKEVQFVTPKINTQFLLENSGFFWVPSS